MIQLLYYVYYDVYIVTYEILNARQNQSRAILGIILRFSGLAISAILLSSTIPRFLDVHMYAERCYKHAGHIALAMTLVVPSLSIYNASFPTLENGLICVDKGTLGCYAAAKCCTQNESMLLHGHYVLMSAFALIFSFAFLARQQNQIGRRKSIKNLSIAPNAKQAQSLTGFERICVGCPVAHRTFDVASRIDIVDGIAYVKPSIIMWEGFVTLDSGYTIKLKDYLLVRLVCILSQKRQKACNLSLVVWPTNLETQAIGGGIRVIAQNMPKINGNIHPTPIGPIATI